MTAKYSQSTTNLFGVPNSKNSSYLDISATFDLGNGFSVVPHIGSQKIKNFGTYTDYSLTVDASMHQKLGQSWLTQAGQEVRGTAAS